MYIFLHSISELRGTKKTTFPLFYVLCVENKDEFLSNVEFSLEEALTHSSISSTFFPLHLPKGRENTPVTRTNLFRFSSFLSFPLSRPFPSLWSSYFISFLFTFFSWNSFIASSISSYFAFALAFPSTFLSFPSSSSPCMFAGCINVSLVRRNVDICTCE